MLAKYFAVPPTFFAVAQTMFSLKSIGKSTITKPSKIDIVSGVTSFLKSNFFDLLSRFGPTSQYTDAVSYTHLLIIHLLLFKIIVDLYP